MTTIFSTPHYLMSYNVKENTKLSNRQSNGSYLNNLKKTNVVVLAHTLTKKKITWLISLHLTVTETKARVKRSIGIQYYTRDIHITIVSRSLF